MLLTFDIGNTNIKAGLFDKSKLIEQKHFKNILTLTDYLKGKKYITGSAVSSVVPEKQKEVSEIVYKLFNISCFIISNKVRFNLNINYDTPETLGTDRICSSEGAFYLFKNSEDFKEYNAETYVITIDFGTATTINIIDYPGSFIGGIISPGLRMMFNSLSKSTAQLPDVEPSDYLDIIGRTTKASIATGVINSSIGLIDKVLSYIKNELSAKKIKIFITGGNAGYFPQHLKYDFEYEKSLVLYGIKAIYDLNNK